VKGKSCFRKVLIIFAKELDYCHEIFLQNWYCLDDFRENDNFFAKIYRILVSTLLFTYRTVSTCYLKFKYRGNHWNWMHHGESWTLATNAYLLSFLTALFYCSDGIEPLDLSDLLTLYLRMDTRYNFLINLCVAS
jgi:hypothetical protein